MAYPARVSSCGQWFCDQIAHPQDRQYACATIGRMNLRQIKAIIFDFGNVLLEWDPRYVYQRFFPDDPEGMERFLEEVRFMEWNLHQDKGRPFAEGVAILSKEFPHYADLIQAYHDHWTDSLG